MPSNSLNTQSLPESSRDELPVAERLNASGEDSGNLGKQEDGLNTHLRDHLGSLFEGLLFLSEPEFDAAILGVARRIGQEDVIAYDYNKVCDIVSDMIGDDDPSNVVEYVEFNILGAYVGERTPVFIDIV
jgi:hypothetical protein